MPIDLKMECPGCESEQQFAVRVRKTQYPSIIELFVSCRKCPYEDHLRFSTAPLERMRKVRARLAARGSVYRQKNGSVPMHIVRAIARADGIIANEEAVVRKAVS
jgi:C4-type Zn-finger protein